MQILKFGIAVAAFSIFSTGVAIGGSQTGKVTNIVTRSHDGLIYFTLDGTPTGKPACASNLYWILQNPNTEIGKRQFAALLAARANDLPVSVIGGGTCNTWYDGEDADTIQY